jgi:hypothetical protein
MMIDIYKCIIDGILLGYGVRKTYNKQKTFRLRRGNGYYNSVKGELYQDVYNYTVPRSISNVEGEPYRQLLSSAVHTWRSVLTESDKKYYRDRATTCSGYCLFIQKYIKTNQS